MVGGRFMCDCSLECSEYNVRFRRFLEVLVKMANRHDQVAMYGLIAVRLDMPSYIGRYSVVEDMEVDVAEDGLFWK